MAPETPRRHRKGFLPWFRITRSAYLVCAVLTLAMCLFAGLDARKVRPNDGTVWLLGRSDIRIVEVLPRADGSTATLQVGDTILGIGTTLVTTPQDAAKELSRQQVGTTVPYLVERGGRVLRVPVQLAEFRTADRFYLYYSFLAFAYWLIGLWVYLKGRNDLPAQLFLLMSLLFAIFFMTNLSRSSYFWGDIISQNAGALARFFLPIIFLHFFLVFPEKKIFITQHPATVPLLYLLPLVFYVQFTIDQFFGGHAPRIYNTRWLILGIYFSVGVAALLHSYLNQPDPVQRRRLRILTYGTLGGILPFLMLTVLPGGRSDANIAFLGTAPLIAIPLSFGYGIARYRVMQIEVLLKRRLIYFSLTGAVMLTYFLMILGLGFVFFSISGQTSQLVAAAATLVIAALLWPARAHLQELLDRRFFMSQSNLAQVLQEISRELPRLIQSEAVVDRVGNRLCKVLDLPRLGIFLREHGDGGGTWRLAGEARPEDPDGDRTAAPPSCPETMDLPAMARRLEEVPEPYWIEVRDDASIRSVSTREQADLAERLAEESLLAERGLALLVPMTTQGRLIGMLALPPKRSGDSFLIQDLELLSMVSGQIALQLENSRLYEEELKNQKLEEQLSLARTIQSRLLPSRIPAVAGVELAACNITSAQVSGDYYDLIEQPGGTLAMVISDVSGKGVPASLLASSLQASLRAHCDSSDAPGLILERVNRYLHASTNPEHFATLFLAIFDPVSRDFRYSSGGHDPALLRRRDGSIEELGDGGLPIGAFEFSEYAEGAARLEPGDLLFLYTDGLTETHNGEDEQFGRERIKTVLDEHHHLAPGELIKVMNQRLQAFSGRTEADDDITLIALKVAGRPAAKVDLQGNFGPDST